jgi:hypothetical protein
MAKLPAANVRIRKETADRLKAWCKAHGLKLLWAVDSAIEEWILKQKKEADHVSSK